MARCEIAASTLPGPESAVLCSSYACFLSASSYLPLLPLLSAFPALFLPLLPLFSCSSCSYQHPILLSSSFFFPQEAHEPYPEPLDADRASQSGNPTRRLTTAPRRTFFPARADRRRARQETLASVGAPTDAWVGRWVPPFRAPHLMPCDAYRGRQCPPSSHGPVFYRPALPAYRRLPSKFPSALPFSPTTIRQLLGSGPSSHQIEPSVLEYRPHVYIYRAYVEEAPGCGVRAEQSGELERRCVDHQPLCAIIINRRCHCVSCPLPCLFHTN